MTTLTVHVTKRGLAHLLGRLDGTLEATLEFGVPACDCPPPVFGFPFGTQVSVTQVDQWKEGMTIRLPTCPACSVLWDEAVATLPPPRAPSIP